MRWEVHPVRVEHWGKEQRINQQLYSQEQPIIAQVFRIAVGQHLLPKNKECILMDSMLILHTLIWTGVVQQSMVIRTIPLLMM